MPDIDFEVISETAIQATDAVLVRRGGGAPNTGALIDAEAFIARANHTGTQLASTISDLAAAVAATASVTLNTAKITNATHTGEVTGSVALTIADNAVTNAKAADMAGFTVKAKPTTGTGDPTDLAIGTNAVLGRVAGDIVAAQLVAGQVATNTLTAATQAQMAANTVKSNATAGTANESDLAVGTNVVVGRVAGNIVAAQLVAAQIADGVVTRAKLENVATATFRGRTTAGTGIPEDLTTAQATALLDVATAAAKGLGPVRSGVSTEYLSGTGVYSTPAGGGGGTSIGLTIAISTFAYTI